MRHGRLLSAVALLAATVHDSASAAGVLSFTFSLDHACFATLVLDDSSGVRVRNLVSETAFGAGSHRLTWDLSSDSIVVDDTGRGVSGERATLVPGRYRVRGLVRGPVDLRYQFSVYNPGVPPWETSDGTGQWLADHSPPAGCVYVPETGEIIVTAEVSESSAGVIWLDSTGRKTYELDNVSGWKCPSAMTRDAATGRVFGALSTGGVYEFTGRRASPIGNITSGKIRGISARDNLVVVSKVDEGKVALVDVSGTPRLLRFVDIPSPRGSAFGADGKFLVLSDSLLLRGTIQTTGLADPETLVTGLDNPMGLVVDSARRLYVSQWGDSTYNILVFDSAGMPLHAIGTPGPERGGPYNRNHMVRPFGMTIDGLGRLWVAEANYVPKRVSVWELDGKLVRYFLGPTKYGGGGVVCPCDTTRFFYAEERDRGSMEFAIDWATGAWDLKNILGRGVTAQTPFCRDGVVYLTNEHAGYPTAAPSRIDVFTVDGGVAIPVASVGAAPDDSLLKVASFAALWNSSAPDNYLYLWSDLDRDGVRQDGEVTFVEAPGIAVKGAAMDAEFGVTLSTGRGIYYLPAAAFAAGEAPRWRASALRLLTALKAPAIRTPDSAVVLHGNPLRGVTGERVRWTYPNPWPGVHASWTNQTPPTHPGQIIGGTIWLYNTVRPRNSDIGDLVALNGNMGNIYLLSSDGLFVATLFQHFRVGTKGYGLNPTRGTGRGWHLPRADRGMLVNGVSLGEECFWPNIMQTPGGDIQVIAGHEHASIVTVEGLESVRRISLGETVVEDADLESGAEYALTLTFENPEQALPVSVGRAGEFGVRVVRNGLRIDSPKGARVEIALFTATGSRVVRRSVRAEPGVVVDLGELPSGIWFYMVRSEAGAFRGGTFPSSR